MLSVSLLAGGFGLKLNRAQGILAWNLAFCRVLAGRVIMEYMLRPDEFLCSECARNTGRLATLKSGALMLQSSHMTKHAIEPVGPYVLLFLLYTRLEQL
jgi:hypothetical protein